MDNRDILAIGASSGGVEALRFIASELPGDLPASVLITIHISPEYPSRLDEILSRAGPLRAGFASEGDALAKGRIYIAPPERHLLVYGHHLALGSGPRENHARPAIDPMLRSAAICCAARAVGVILTGALDDGAAGLCALSACGGLTIVQDPGDALVPAMPLAALTRAKPDHISPLADMPGLLKALVEQPAGLSKAAPDWLRLEVDIARGTCIGMDEMDRMGSRLALSCPECGGAVWEIEEGALIRRRRHAGHGRAAELLGILTSETVRAAMGSALRAIRERLAVARRLHKESRERGLGVAVRSWGRRIEELERDENVIVDAMQRADRLTSEAEDAPDRSA